MHVAKNTPECFLEIVEDDYIYIAVNFEVLTEDAASSVRCVCCFSVG